MQRYLYYSAALIYNSITTKGTVESYLYLIKKHSHSKQYSSKPEKLHQVRDTLRYHISAHQLLKDSVAVTLLFLLFFLAEALLKNLGLDKITLHCTLAVVSD